MLELKKGPRDRWSGWEQGDGVGRETAGREEEESQRQGRKKEKRGRSLNRKRKKLPFNSRKKKRADREHDKSPF